VGEDGDANFDARPAPLAAAETFLDAYGGDREGSSRSTDMDGPLGMRDGMEGISKEDTALREHGRRK
jgi:hypothetical protein